MNVRNLTVLSILIAIAFYLSRQEDAARVVQLVNDDQDVDQDELEYYDGQYAETVNASSIVETDDVDETATSRWNDTSTSFLDALNPLDTLSPPVLVNRTFGKIQDEDVNDVLEELSQCETLHCAIKAHDKLAGRTRFNFPHFFLIGWQKCATTSVNAYLRFHPQYLPGKLKEPHHFSVCQHRLDAPHCMSKSESQYLRDFLRLENATASRLEKVTLDASADYAQAGGPLARKLYRLFPWTKVVIMMREPISRLISYTRMHTESTYQEWKACPADSSLFKCLFPKLRPGRLTSNYSEPLIGWLTTFPPEQIHVIQFEELQEDPEKVLYDLKVFLGMDINFPERKFSNINSRRRLKEGYPMKKGHYQRLIRMVRWDAERVAEILDRYGLADRSAWLSRWQAVWQANLSRCNPQTGVCMVDSN